MCAQDRAESPELQPAGVQLRVDDVTYCDGDGAADQWGDDLRADVLDDQRGLAVERLHLYRIRHTDACGADVSDTGYAAAWL